MDIKEQYLNAGISESDYDKLNKIISSIMDIMMRVLKVITVNKKEGE